MIDFLLLRFQHGGIFCALQDVGVCVGIKEIDTSTFCRDNLKGFMEYLVKSGLQVIRTGYKAGKCVVQH